MQLIPNLDEVFMVRHTVVGSAGSGQAVLRNGRTAALSMAALDRLFWAVKASPAHKLTAVPWPSGYAYKVDTRGMDEMSALRSSAETEMVVTISHEGGYFYYSRQWSGGNVAEQLIGRDRAQEIVSLNPGGEGRADFGSQRPWRYTVAIDIAGEAI